MSNSSLHRQAFIYNGSIDKNIGKFEAYITEFITLNQGNDRPLLIRITSSGGVPEQIFGLCGLLRQVQNEGHEVWVHVLGQLCNFTYMVAAVADKVMMEPTASFVFGQMTVCPSGNITKIASYLKFQRQLFSKLVNAIAERSDGKLEASTVNSWRDKHFSAQEAFELGLCDEVLAAPDAKKCQKTKLPEWVLRVNGSFANDVDIYNLQISLHAFIEDAANNGRPIRVYLTSWGGTVVQALALYGLLYEAQRTGHHVTIHVVGEAYSCALWFATVALKAGTVMIDSFAMLMFHAPWIDAISVDLDAVEERLSVELGVYAQTRALLQQIPGFTDEVIATWEPQPDTYLTAQEVVAMGLGELVSGKDRKSIVEVKE